MSGAGELVILSMSVTVGLDVFLPSADTPSACADLNVPYTRLSGLGDERIPRALSNAALSGAPAQHRMRKRWSLDDEVWEPLRGEIGKYTDPKWLRTAFLFG